MSIPYRARRALRHFIIGALVLALFASLILVCWLLWLNRYVIYGRDGAKLDFSLSIRYDEGEEPLPPEPNETVPIYNKTEDEEEGTVSTELTNFSGYYVTLAQLTENYDNISKKLQSLPAGTAVMLELKDVRGCAYYSSDICREGDDLNTETVDGLLKTLMEQDLYIIVRIPAFQEYYFIMENERERVPYGLPKAGGSGSLWLDSDGPCYWLDPASDGTLTYLIQLLTELRSKGVDEVVFSDFRFPYTDKISYSGDPMTALTECAAKLVKTCATERFCISFTRPNADLQLPAGRTRLYLTGVSGIDIADIVAQSGLDDPNIQLVFLTESGDERFDQYCVLRPLEAEQ